MIFSEALFYKALVCIIILPSEGRGRAFESRRAGQNIEKRLILNGIGLFACWAQEVATRNCYTVKAIQACQAIPTGCILVEAAAALSTNLGEFLEFARRQLSGSARRWLVE